MISLGPTLGGDGDDVGLPQLGDGLHQGGRGEGREVGTGEGHWTTQESPRREVKHLMIIIIIIIIIIITVIITLSVGVEPSTGLGELRPLEEEAVAGVSLSPADL